MHIPFSKYSGCGNDFILIDNRKQIFDEYLPSSASPLCHRNLGIGADGIVLLENSSTADFRMRIFNADGSEAEMCGNGLRCLARFIQELEIPGKKFLIETMHQQLSVSLSDESVSVRMPAPTHSSFFSMLQLDDRSFTVHFVNTGVPHTVIFVDEIMSSALMDIAPKIRSHPDFAPAGTNVNFAMIDPKLEVHMRTYERGVERETLACGTGAAAVAIAAAKVHRLNSPISIHFTSGSIIQIAFDTLSSEPLLSSELLMVGPAVKLFDGRIDSKMAIFFQTKQISKEVYC